MPGRLGWYVVLVLGMWVGLCGCDSSSASKRSSRPKELFIPPVYQSGTVAEYARLVGGAYLPVRGYGVVIGLGKEGGRDIPPQLKNYMEKYLLLQGLGSSRKGMQDITPSRLLRDPDTAVVEITGVIPPGSPQGKEFDLSVRAMGSDVRSLAGGRLLTADLRMAISSREDPERGSRVMATASGQVFVNPFIDENKPAERVKFREGRIGAGGVVKESRPIRLQLLVGDYAQARKIERAINARFQRPGARKVANAKSSSGIDLVIPTEWKDEYERFLDLVMHLPVRRGGGWWEKKAAEVAKAMEQPTANHNQLALVWEAMGRRVLPLISTRYTSHNANVSYYAARTGMRLGDKTAAPEVVLQAARTTDSPLQLEAIRELGEHGHLYRSVELLRKLLDDPNELVRVGAYESLRRTGMSAIVKSYDIGGGFRLDVVDSSQTPAIYATTVGEPRIVLFQKEIPVRIPIFFTAWDNLITINGIEGQKKLAVFRMLPHSGRRSDIFRIKPNVEELVLTLGNTPEKDESGRIQGLGFTYSHVVGVLSRLCRDKAIDAKFVLQQTKELQGFGRVGGSGGRPNIPGS